jgi:hypothetical protein
MHSAGLVMNGVRVSRANGVSTVEEVLTEVPRWGAMVIVEAEANSMAVVAVDSMVAEAVAAGNDSYFAKSGVVIINNR